jgi:hypothetical protein
MAYKTRASWPPDLVRGVRPARFVAEVNRQRASVSMRDHGAFPGGSLTRTSSADSHTAGVDAIVNGADARALAGQS